MILLEVLRNAGLRRVSLAYALFAVCEFALWIGMLVYAYDQGGATTAGVVALVQLLPSAATAFGAAPLAARFSPARVLIATYVLQAVSSAATAVALFAGAPSVVAYAGAVVVSATIPVVRPLQSVILPALATEVKQLTAANVVLGVVESVGVLVAGTATGLALTWGSVGHVFAGATILLVISAVLTLPLAGVRYTVRTHSATTTDTARVGDRAARRRSRSLTSLIVSENVVVGALDILFVVLAVDILRAGESWTGYLNTAFGAGALVVGALGALLVGRRLGPVIIVTALVVGGALALTTGAGLAVVVGLVAVTGGGRALFDVAVRVLLQRSVAPQDAVRIFGAAEGLSVLGLAAGSLMVPALVALGGTDLAVLGTAALLPLHVLLQARTILRIDDHARVPVVEISLLGQIELFRALPATETEALARSMVPERFETGQRIIAEGESGDRYYAIADGEVEVSQGGRPINRLGRGDGFGEIALLRSVPRTATVTAIRTTTAYALDRSSFLNAVTGHGDTRLAVESLVTELEDRDVRRDRESDS